MICQGLSMKYEKRQLSFLDFTIIIILIGRLYSIQGLLGCQQLSLLAFFRCLRKENNENGNHL